MASEQVQQNFRMALDTVNAALASDDQEAINQSLETLIVALDAKIKLDQRTIPGSDGFIRCSLDHPNRPSERFCDECGEQLS